jgi:hypothetical protein
MMPPQLDRRRPAITPLRPRPRDGPGTTPAGEELRGVQSMFTSLTGGVSRRFERSERNGPNTRSLQSTSPPISVALVPVGVCKATFTNNYRELMWEQARLHVLPAESSKGLLRIKLLLTGSMHSPDRVHPVSA